MCRKIYVSPQRAEALREILAKVEAEAPGRHTAYVDASPTGAALAGSSEVGSSGCGEKRTPLLLLDFTPAQVRRCLAWGLSVSSVQQARWLHGVRLCFDHTAHKSRFALRTTSPHPFVLACMTPAAAMVFGALMPTRGYM